MIEKFKDIDYLKHGTKRQKLAYSDIKKHHVFEKLANFHPILTGTIPIEIDLPESDLDIICHCTNPLEFSEYLQLHFGHHKEFTVKTCIMNGIHSCVAKFKTSNFIFEIFGQNSAVEKQNAYRHMIIEYRILLDKKDAFKNKIIALKSSGIKTEAAFAELLHLKGNPFEALLKLEKMYL